MEPLEQIINGEPMESVREKINALIDAYNLAFPVTKSYLDLTDKPAIDGIELLPDTKMKQINVPIESLPSNFDLQQLFIDAAQIQAEIIAKQVAQQEIENIFKLQNIPRVMGFIQDDWKLLVYVPQSDNTMKLHQTTMEEVTEKAVWAANRFKALNSISEPES